MRASPSSHRPPTQDTHMCRPAALLQRRAQRTHTPADSAPSAQNTMLYGGWLRRGRTPPTDGDHLHRTQDGRCVGAPRTPVETFGQLTRGADEGAATGWPQTQTRRLWRHRRAMNGAGPVDFIAYVAGVASSSCVGLQARARRGAGRGRRRPRELRPRDVD
jgi:hypothetical protein